MRKSSRSVTAQGYLIGYGVPLPGYQSIVILTERQ